MPYILMKRSDVPDGTLQILDLQPNTSQRNPTYQTAGQTKYIKGVTRATPSLSTVGGVVTFNTETSGLEAWFLTHVTDGAAAAATGTVTVAAAAALDTFTIPTTPAFTLAAVNAPRTPGGLDFEDVASAGSDILSADSLVAAINDAANWVAAGATKTVTADNAGGTSAVVTLTADADGTIYNYVLTSSTGVRLAVVPMAGGLDANSLTSAEAVQDVTDILGLLNYGAAGAAGALTLAATNGALTTGTISAGQLPDILDILAGRTYTVPAGTQIEAASAFAVSPAVGAVGGPDFQSTTLRNLYASGDLSISFGVGALSKMASAAFTYLGATGAAVAVYNDDGSLFT